MLSQLCDTSLGQRLRSPEVCGPCTVHTIPGHLFIYHLCGGSQIFSLQFTSLMHSLNLARQEPNCLLSFSFTFCIFTVLLSPHASFESRNHHRLPSFSLGPTSHHILPIVILRYILLFTRLHFGHHCWVSDHHSIQPALLKQASSS